MRNKVLVLVMVYSLVTCSGNLVAKERRGAEVVITKIDGQQIKGELVAVKPSSLLLLDSQTSGDVSADINNIIEVKILKKSEFWKTAGIGLLAGALFGALLGGFAGEQEGDMPMSTGQSILAGAILLAGPVALIGGVAGILHGKDETIHLEGKSPEETKAVMEKLRSKARVTDFQ